MRRLRDDSHISAYLDEMLSGREMVQVSEYLDSTPDAQRALEELERTVEVLRRLPDPDPPPDFWPRTHHRLRAYARLQARRARFRELLRTLFGATSVLLLLACVGACVSVG